MKSLDHPTLWYCTRKPTTLPYKVQDSSLWISGMRDPYIDDCKGSELASGILISVFSLIVLDSTWRLMISYSSLGEFREESVIGEVSGRFPNHPPCKLSLPFVYSRHRTVYKCSLVCITLFTLSRWDASHPLHWAICMVQFWPILSSFRWRTSGRWCNQLTLFL